MISYKRVYNVNDRNKGKPYKSVNIIKIGTCRLIKFDKQT